MTEFSVHIPYAKTFFTKKEGQISLAKWRQLMNHCFQSPTTLFAVYSTVMKSAAL